MSSGFVLHARFPSFRPSRFRLPEGATLVGRSSECDFIIRDNTVSRQHAEIEILDQSAKVRDLESSNGTYLDGGKIRESRLRCGQEVRFGNVAFLFQSTDSEDFDSDQMTKNLDDEKAPGTGTTQVDSLVLTPAQRRVLKMLLEGHSEKRVAHSLQVAPQTIHSHIKEIYRACGVHSRAELLALFVRREGGKSPHDPSV